MSEIEQWRVEEMMLEDLIPADYNPRKISTKAFEGLGNSLDEFGLLQPVIYNERSGNIVGGHMRFKHLVETGEKKTQVIVVDLDDIDEIALNVALNNKEAQGDFTSDVKEMLNVSEVQLGARFEEIGLQDLRDALKFPEEPDESTPVKDPTDKKGDGGSGGMGGGPIDDSPDAVVSCPRCSSKWRMHNGEVIHNAKSE